MASDIKLKLDPVTLRWCAEKLDEFMRTPVPIDSPRDENLRVIGALRLAERFRTRFRAEATRAERKGEG